MAGGDWPVSVLAGGYIKAWTIYREILSAYAPDIRSAVLSRTAIRFYNLQLPEG
jgi:L-fuconolactonase